MHYYSPAMQHVSPTEASALLRQRLAHLAPRAEDDPRAVEGDDAVEPNALRPVLDPPPHLLAHMVSRLLTWSVTSHVDSLPDLIKINSETKPSSRSQRG